MVHCLVNHRIHTHIYKKIVCICVCECLMHIELLTLVASGKSNGIRKDFYVIVCIRSLYNSV